MDLRVRHPYDAYAYVPLRQCSASSGCAYARCMVLLDEIEESSKLMTEGLQRMRGAPYELCHPHAPIQVDKESIKLRTTSLMRHCHVYGKGVLLEGCAYGCVEGPGGEKGVSIIANGYKPLRVKVRPSTLPCMVALSLLSGSVAYEDLPILIASLGLAPTEIDR